jgi:hypothetical protein
MINGLFLCISNYQIYRKIAVDKFDKFDKRIRYFFTTILRKNGFTSLLTTNCLKYCTRDTNTVKNSTFKNGPKK